MAQVTYGASSINAVNKKPPKSGRKEVLILELSFNEKKLLSLLKTGEENAQTGNELGVHFDADDSFIRTLTHSSKVKGIPVCSSNNGYYWGKDENEIRACGRRERARIAKQQAAVKVFDKYEKPPSANGGKG